MDAATRKAETVPAWLWLAPAGAASLPPAFIAGAWLLSLLGPHGGGAYSFAELFLLLVLFAPVVGLFVLVYLAAGLLLRGASLRDRGAAAAAALAVLCVAEPVILLATTILTHGITR